MRTQIEASPKKGTAQNLLYDLYQLTSALLNEPHTLRKPLSMEEGVKVKGGASENYKRMGRFGSMVFYHLVEDRDNFLKFRIQTLNYLRNERENGHMGGEQGCSQPHDGMHLAATLLAHLFATQEKDTVLLEETGWWIGSYLAICQACYHPSYPRVAIPGFRIKDTPLSQCRDLIYQRCVLGILLDTSLPSGNKIQWQRFYLPVKLAFKLDEMWAIPKPSSTLPKLLAPMKVDKSASSLSVSIDVPVKTSGKAQTVTGIEIENGHLTYIRRTGEEVTL